MIPVSVSDWNLVGVEEWISVAVSSIFNSFPPTGLEAAVGPDGSRVDDGDWYSNSCSESGGWLKSPAQTKSRVKGVSLRGSDVSIHSIA